MKIIPMMFALSLTGHAGLSLAQSEPALPPGAEPALRPGVETTLPHGAMPHFDVVDTNKDGFLGIEEARAAFNDLVIDDTNGNGFVEKGEAENALPGLRYTNDTHEDNEDRVGPAEYSMMAEQFVRGHIDEDSEL